MALDELFIPYPYELKNVPYRKLLYVAGKILPFGALLYILFNLHKLNSRQLLICLLPVIYFVYLVFESLYYYGTFFQFPHVGLKILNLIVAGAFYIFYLQRDIKDLNVVMYIILGALLVKIAIDPSMLAPSAFVRHVRGIPSPSALMLLLPCLYFFNIYIVELKQSALMKFILLLLLIIFFQHRSVWVATFVAFLFNTFLLNRQHKITANKAIPGIIPVGFFILLVSSVVLTYLPDVVYKINANIENILNPSQEESTSEWRMEQMESYLPFVKEYPIEGMRLKGFELPVQFYHEGANIQIFEDNTGHHFHNFYFDKLFYFGLIGLFIFLIYLLKPFINSISDRLELDHYHVSILSFSFSGLIYGLAYDLPLYYWALLGISMAIVDKKKLFTNTQSK